MYGTSSIPAGRMLAAVAAAAVVVCFFLPWITAPVLFVTISASGATLASFRAMLWLSPLAAVVIIVIVMLAQSPSSSVSNNAGILILVGAIVALLPPVAVLLELMSPQVSLTSLLGIGFWGTMIACVAAIVGGIMDMASSGEQMQQAWVPPTEPQPLTPVQLPPTPTQAPPPVRMERTRLVQESPRALAWVAVKAGQRAGQQFGLHAVSRLGRSGEGEVVLDDDAVSWNHARINYEGGQFYLYDLASRNGTFVNSRRIQRQLLYDNDQITLGHTVLIFKRA